MNNINSDNLRKEESNSNKDSNPQPNFYAIIPATVRYCKEIEMGAKLLYAEITSLTHREGYCWATNKYFSELYEVDTSTIQRWLSSLVKLNFIIVEVNKQAGNTRKIWVLEGIKNFYTSPQNCGDLTSKMRLPHLKNATYNIKENTKEEKKENINTKERPAAPPPSADAEEIYSCFFQKLREINKEFKEPNAPKWKQEIDQMLRLDKRDPYKVKMVLEWALSHSNWQRYILSPKALRKNYDRLVVQMKAELQDDVIFQNKCYAMHVYNLNRHDMPGFKCNHKNVVNTENAKDIEFSLPHEVFKERLYSIFGGE